MHTMKRFCYLMSFYLMLTVTSLMGQIPTDSPVDLSPVDPAYPIEQVRPNTAVEDTGRFMTEFMHMLTTLGLIIAFLLIATWALRRLTHSRMQQINVTSDVKILETRTLSTKSNLYLLDVKGQEILIGESVNGLTLLTHLDVPFDSAEELEDTSFENPSLKDENSR